MIGTRLQLNQLPLIQEMLLARASIGKQKLSEEELQDVLLQIETAMKEYPKHIIYWGVLQDKKLRCFLSQEFRDRFKDDWNMSFLMTNPSFGSAWNYQKNGLDALWRAAFSIGNYRGRRTVRWSLPAAWAGSQIKTQRTSLVWPKYNIESYRVVPAGELPSDDLDSWVFGKRVKSYDVVLRKASRI